MFFVLILLLCISSVYAKDNINNTTQTNNITPKIIVTATRDEQPMKNVPYSGTIFNANELRIENPARTIPEALKTAPGTMIQKTGHGQGSPYIRGFTGYRNLFLIDGIRLNNSVFRDGPNQYWNTVDVLGLRRIELMRGPYSVLYGSDAIGGTVNAITRGKHDLRYSSNWDRHIYYRYSSAENSNIGRLESIGNLTDQLTLTLGYSYKDFGDLQGGRKVGTQEKTGYTEKDWDAKLEYFINKDTSITFANQNVNIDDAWRTHKTIYGIDWEGLSVGKELKRSLDQDRNLTYLQYNQYNINSFVDEIHAGISRHYQGEDRERIRTNNRYDNRGFDVTTFGTFLSLESLSAVGKLIYGFEFYHDEVDSFNKTLNSDGTVKKYAIQGPIGDDATYNTLGIYIQDEVSLTKQLILILGGRYEFANANAEKVENPVTGQEISISDNWDDVVGNARILYALDEKKSYNLFAGISQGFRAPNLSDLTRFDSARTDEIETPAPGLNPEHFISYETGLNIGTPELTAQFAYFYTHINDMIIRTPTARIIDGEHEVTKKNSGNGYVTGIEIDGNYHFMNYFTLFGTFTWMDGKIDTYPTSDAELTKEYIDRLMPPTGRIGINWYQNGYWLEVSCNIAAKADKLSTRDKADTSRIPPGGTPGYTVYNIRSGWDISEDIAISLSVENITDEDYRIHGSGVNEPGRNIILAIDTTF